MDFESGSSILGWIPIRIRIQSGSRVWCPKIAIYLSLGLYKRRPSYRRSHQKRTSSTSKHEISDFFLFFAFFCHPDPDPKHCFKHRTFHVEITRGRGVFKSPIVAHKSMQKCLILGKKKGYIQCSFLDFQASGEASPSPKIERCAHSKLRI